MMNVYKALLGISNIIGYPSRVFKRAIKERTSNILILNYHDVTKTQFRNHIQFLEKWFEFGKIEDVVNALQNHDFPEDPTVVITFDDGLASFYHNAFPTIEELDIPVVNYVTSGYVDSEFWYNPKTGSLIIYKDFIPNPLHVVPSIIPKNRKEALTMGYYIRHCMSSNELIETDRHHCVAIGGHSVTHPSLANVTDDDSWHQISGSKLELERILGHSIEHFAYPNGSFSSREMEFAKKAGFISAAAVTDRWIEKDSNPFCFPRKGSGPCGSSVAWLKYRIGK